MNIAAWLASLGLEQYQAAFAENDVDGDVLRGLTGDDLKDIGIVSLGHRKKLLEASDCKPSIFWPPSMAGSPKASACQISTEHSNWRHDNLRGGRR